MPASPCALCLLELRSGKATRTGSNQLSGLRCLPRPTCHSSVLISVLRMGTFAIDVKYAGLFRQPTAMTAYSDYVLAPCMWCARLWMLPARSCDEAAHLLLAGRARRPRDEHRLSLPLLRRCPLPRSSLAVRLMPCRARPAPAQSGPTHQRCARAGSLYTARASIQCIPSNHASAELIDANQLILSNSIP